MQVDQRQTIVVFTSIIHILPPKTDLLYWEIEEKPVIWTHKCKSVTSPHMSELLGTKYGHFFCHCIIGRSPKVAYILSVLLEKSWIILCIFIRNLERREIVQLKEMARKQICLKLAISDWKQMSSDSQWSRSGKKWKENRKGGILHREAGNMLKREVRMHWDQSIRCTYSGNIGNEMEKIGSPWMMREGGKSLLND